jgi:hypothetical protein
MLQLDAANMKAGRSNQEAPRLPNGLANRWGSIGERVFGVKLAARSTLQSVRFMDGTADFRYRRRPSLSGRLTPSGSSENQTG